ncbi:MAG: 3-hydroxy-3-methylglutaryl CoA synthase [Deltaproteobacteria bacterium]|jgi:3-hydroxy-3-methylglutaryl CoA synthase|nr:3-hydroxy-3-methylglutaryl CoA synthase [Deltaproteobacteria bacterium]MBT4641855.1 3-hydroxy-3-methylglutaryl CoA synthase [Deltaproteobacteria bacterium]MBT6504596.1 3-hydroxy-3-methylglutaryl CoA synthase [Deltaproteobacteria bacterium]MBT6615266.1 3-hydroxy-3-methylglutaryl CoA synthase [Deltaproteobacteria bacterium]MBT7151213.1 3-hydroxy-3-methylglutaryl CoA synthase [Deltaproteobacteria bacterium]
MVGITSYGGYIPRLRLNRGVIYGANAWMAPGLIGSAGGERSMANWDEDSLTMAVEAARNCIAGFDKIQIDATYMASVNFPFEDRLNSGVLATALNLNRSLDSADFTASQRAGASAVMAGINAVKSGDFRNVLVAAGDRRITKMAYTHELLAGDGAAALLLGSDNVIAEFKGAATITEDFVDHYRGEGAQFDYNWEERWIKDEGILKIVPATIQSLFEKTGVSGKDIDRFVMPCLFPRVPMQISGMLEIAPEKTADNMHNICGDTGTAHPLVMLIAELEKAKPGDKILVAAFGQGCTALLFEVTDKISGMNGQNGIKQSLADRKEEQNYLKFLSHRGLLQQDLTMRAEANWKTALSALYRSRKMILGMVGGKCQTCGTAQFPKADVCVNPACNAVNTQSDCEFADQPGKVKTYTSDLLTYTPDPPAHYGMVTFENGGRGMFDFTDYETGKVEVGLPVRMVFRIRNIDSQRKFTQYFWKAKPVIKQEEA